MTKRKSLASKLFLLIVLLTLISCCFLGSTFARYTSGGSGTATLSVAKWNIEGPAEGEMDVTFSKLSPSKDEYVSTARTHSTGRELAATIVNKSDVDALVTLTADNEQLTNILGNSWGDYSEDVIKGLFAIKIYTNTENKAEGATEYTSAVKLTAASDGTAQAGGTLYVYVEVTWTSDTEGVTGDEADKRDTWVGENISAVSYTLSYKAVQDSELPVSN